jgi:amino-acid N-acetyltransferase
MKQESGLSIRDAAPGDLAPVLDLLRAANLPTEGVAEGFVGFAVAEADARIVAAAGLERYGASALLRSVVVDPAWRGREVGGALVERLLERAEREGLAAVYLLTTTADQWFPRFGFRRAAREEVPPEIRASGEFADVCPASAVVMVRPCGSDGTRVARHTAIRAPSP